MQIRLLTNAPSFVAVSLAFLCHSQPLMIVCPRFSSENVHSQIHYLHRLLCFLANIESGNTELIIHYFYWYWMKNVGVITCAVGRADFAYRAYCKNDKTCPKCHPRPLPCQDAKTYLKCYLIIQRDFLTVIVTLQGSYPVLRIRTFNRDINWLPNGSERRVSVTFDPCTLIQPTYVCRISDHIYFVSKLSNANLYVRGIIFVSEIHVCGKFNIDATVKADYH